MFIETDEWFFISIWFDQPKSLHDSKTKLCLLWKKEFIFPMRRVAYRIEYCHMHLAMLIHNVIHDVCIHDVVDIMYT